jgi:hypothetical protein
MARFGSLGTQYFDNSGNPLVDGLIDFYEPGTTTRKNTYSDINLTIANTNPVELTAAGRQPNVFFAGTAKAVLRTAAGVVIETRDPVGDTSAGAFSAYLQDFDYPVGALVTDENGEQWASIDTPNIGNEPSASPLFWEPAIDYFLREQTVVDAGRVAVGNSSTGLSSVAGGAIGNYLAVSSTSPFTVGFVAPFPLNNPLTTVTATGAATALLNSGITSTYSVYDLIVVGTTSTADGLNLRVELAGSVISTSTYIYAADGLLSGTGAVAGTNAGTGSPVSSVPLASPGGGATRPFYLKVRIISPGSGTLSTQLVIDNSVITSAGEVSRQTITAMNTGTTALTGIQLIPVSGTITCKMNLYPANFA